MVVAKRFIQDFEFRNSWHLDPTPRGKSAAIARRAKLVRQQSDRSVLHSIVVRLGNSQLALIFELPIVLGFAGAMGVVNAKFLLKHIRGAVLIFFVFAAILTPTTDIMNMTIYAAPMILLYLLSIGIVWLVHPKQRRARREKREQER